MSATTTRPRILVVDDEAGVRFGIRQFLEAREFEVEEADGCGATLEALQSWRPEVVVLDYLLPDGNALDLLPRLQETEPDTSVVILTGHGSIDLAVRAVKQGAENFLTKPVELPVLEVMLNRLVEKQRNQRKQLVRQKLQARDEVDPFLGEAAVMDELEEQARRVVVSDSPILIHGETGVGKGVLARWIHNHGPRSDQDFVDLNCAGLSRELLETELFGHEKGAFTGASSRKPGLLDVAHQGTLFLDEVADMDLQVQPKLLKVLEEKRFRRLGDVRDRRVDVRLIVATHQDLAALVRENRFRTDLYFRISTLPLRVPALREKKQDIPMLARYLLKRIASELGRVNPELTDDAVEALQSYSWPGNVRELRNVLERALLLSDDDVVSRSDLRFESTLLDVVDDDPSVLTLDELTRRHIERVLHLEGGAVAKAADRLGIPKSTLYQRLKKEGIRQTDG